jgi:hypothetical protein
VRKARFFGMMSLQKEKDLRIYAVGLSRFLNETYLFQESFSKFLMIAALRKEYRGQLFKEKES